jgi:phytoene synthase
MSGEMRIMTRAGKTFYFATLWLHKQVRYDAALAYNFCRAVDDIADAEPLRPDRDEYLLQVARSVSTADPRDKLVQPLIPLLERYPEIVRPLVALVDACREDTPALRIHDECDLERYAHGVAGNVGLIMYPILGGIVPEGRALAADLGIAMQCTNIARDVLEDLKRKRVYLPSSWLKGADPVDLLSANPLSEPLVVDAVRRVLAFANERYTRGLRGLHYLAPQNRFAIRIAAHCYAAIGTRVMRNGRLARERAVVPLSQKVLLACKMGLGAKREVEMLEENS